MRFTLLTLLALTLFVNLTAAAAPPAAPVSDENEQALQSAGLGTDGPALLQFFRLRARTEPDRDRLQLLLRQLGDPSQAVRDEAAAELVAWGPLAVPLLRHAANDLDDLGTADRATKCLQSIEGQTGAGLVTAAVHLMAAKKPADAAEVLLAYLPSADDPAVIQEVSAALAAVAYVNGKPESAVLGALRDPMPLRRAVAVTALFRKDQPEQWPAVKKLLKDPKPLVRLRAALPLAGMCDLDAIPVLIDLLADLPSKQRGEAEGVLRSLVGDLAPEDNFGDGETARRNRREAWAACWRSTEGPALLTSLSNRTLNPAIQERIRTRLKQLGDELYDTRERAQADLQAIGTPALPGLREAAKGKDLEVARRATECIEFIEKDPLKELPEATFRWLVLRHPAGAIEALLAYMPFASNERLTFQAQTALNRLAARDEKPDPALLKALEDPLPRPREAAGEALISSGKPEHRLALRQLLTDPDRTIRMRFAVDLVNAHDREAVPVLIDLLAELPADQVTEVMEILLVLAGDKAPKPVSGRSEGARKKNRDQWAAWWMEQGDKADFAQLQTGQYCSGCTLVIEARNGRVVQLDRDNRPRWQIEHLQIPVDAIVLPGNRVLIAEYGADRVTERDLTGKVLWEKADLDGHPVNVQRLANGNTFIATTRQLLQVDRKGKAVYVVENLGYIDAAYKGLDGNIWCLLEKNARCVQLDPVGKELKNFASNRGSNPTSGIDLLPDGGVLITQRDKGQVVEMDADGKILREIPAPRVTTATRLPNGNILAASEEGKRVCEIDRAGKIVWEYQGDFDMFRARRR